ncbi:hypothetical protein [Mycobacterium decipiens]|uniref:hypothetical protein n=1 Tax=Mycobacterium decipiens TaxID=1430326 RepID=UPI001055BEBF|nr:hypothetical protein [Mycobacterium decipiens]
MAITRRSKAVARLGAIAVGLGAGLGLATTASVAHADGPAEPNNDNFAQVPGPPPLEPNMEINPDFVDGGVENGPLFPPEVLNDNNLNDNNNVAVPPPAAEVHDLRGDYPELFVPGPNDIPPFQDGAPGPNDGDN